LVDQHLHVGFARYVDAKFGTADLGCRFTSGLGLNIGDDYCSRALGCKTSA
jgi:hypothetical protein